jgi:hypothetical protein
MVFQSSDMKFVGLPHKFDRKASLTLTVLTLPFHGYLLLGYVTHATDRPLWVFSANILTPDQMTISRAWLDAIDLATKEAESKVSVSHVIYRLIMMAAFLCEAFLSAGGRGADLEGRRQSSLDERY